MIIIIIIDEFQERKNFISFLDDPIDMFLLNIEVPYCPSQTFHLREDIWLSEPPQASQSFANSIKTTIMSENISWSLSTSP